MRAIIFSTLIWCGFAVGAFGQATPQLTPLPVDPKVRYGHLDNGLTYYIRANKEPKQRADFYIVQNVGAILENDDQNGLAHFLEHMAFNGTKNFPGKGILNYMEKNGVKFGENVNAYTNLDETVYNLSNVPTVRDGIIDSSLLVLHDWSSFISLEGSEIDAERGVIREEWRQGAGADRRMWKESNRLKYPGSQYAKRDIIGDTAIINNFSHQTLRDFYQKWYHPDLQAVIIVGDVDVDKVEAKIKTLFADIPKSKYAGIRPIYPIGDNKEPIISIVKDPEARVTRIELEYKHDVRPAEIKRSMAGYAFDVANSLISMMLGNRFDEITQQADAPFVGAYAGYGQLVKSKDAFQMIAVPKEGNELEGLNAILLEGEKMRRFGFTPSELERAKTDMLKRYEKAYNERDNQKNESYVQEYVNNFLNQEPIPGIEWEYKTMQYLLPELKLDMINQMAKSYVTDTNLIVSFMAPDKEAVKIPSREQILSVVSAVKSVSLKARADENIHQPLIRKIPAKGKIKTITENKELGTTEWTLSNGVKVIFKPTQFKKDEVLMNAFSLGGLSKVQNATDLVSGSFATAIVKNNGLANYTSVELEKILTGKIVSVSPQLSEYEEGIDGRTSVSDFETMMQLTYLYFTAPRKDDNAFKAMINSLRTSYANSTSDPDKAFSDSVQVTASGHHPRVFLMNLSTVEKINQEKALAIYKERFAVPADFTFIFTGNIDPQNESVKRTICTYLGGLKSGKGGETFTDNKVRTPKGKVENVFKRDLKIKKASNFILYSGTLPFTVQNRVIVSAIGDILTLRYTESIREKEGGSYGVWAGGSLGNRPVNEATLMMQFDTDPQKESRLMSVIHSEVTEIMEKGPRADDLQKVKENMLKRYGESLHENSFWSAAIERYYKDKLDVVRDYKHSVENLTGAMIQETLKNIVSQGNLLEVVMTSKE